MHASIIVTSPEQIQEIVAQAVREALMGVLPELVRQATQKPFLTQEEAREVTGWSVRTLQTLRDTKKIAFVQHGRKITYPSADLYGYMHAHRIKPRA